MKKYDLTTAEAFQVIHNSKEWRIATHTYDSKVNGAESFRNWGRHLDSEEAFVLLSGESWLVTTAEGKTPEDYATSKLIPFQVYVIQEGERHAILQKPGSQVMIVENEDMANSVTEPIGEEIIRVVKESIYGS